MIGTLTVAVLLVQALRNRLMDLIDRLADAARTDPLTGLQNRRGFEETFGVEVERARRHDRPLTVLSATSGTGPTADSLLLGRPRRLRRRGDGPQTAQ